ncbi:DNA polymerase III subunit gamma/tau [Vibrio cholerae]|uniref:DNA polymerase III subunit gamma/tau n=1 Tax=Vibrio cholerae TaxID=666 RepID=UPI00053C096B|nr:DNA polymerase III subunit gamma/tau [Vibrio cholerae]EGR0680799.1 DNA polymerase III subunit gamma/tau [Vibrio cholerae]EHS1089426.1 DNA polymerase III subunit gamma/tau [Vibrio cholerae]EJL7013255.1 DNA polymerase III subunit gamma/tau [Vibrio cholerae]EKE8760328.1 DNA polymerase III subunit gamma/tau [Vibrio cholerae]EKE8763338.1 DNA polymerase III subunit gamma/tau [Vibrio cholerae]
MSYLALARKWRPTRFSEVVGQSHVLTALENALAQNRLHHAYLFSGTRGVGKTTIGRLFAKGLNCETGITATPCGQCATCQEIDQGRFVDLLEIDAASRTKVEDTRELLDNVQYKPARGRFKVYLIDEVHMLSRHSFNALLKTLEEPPEYVKFLLATTDPQKLPVTILSRCLQFHLKPISVENIQQQLDKVLHAEQISSDSKALNLLAHAADGSMRDALSLTDQAIALGNGVVKSDIVAHMLGTLDTDHALHLLQAISLQTPQAVMDCIETLAQNGVEWDGLLQQLSTQLHRIAMYQALPATLDKSLPEASRIESLAKTLAPQDVQLYYQIALKGRQDLPLSPTARIGIEMLMLRMMAFRPSHVSLASVIVPPNTAVTTPTIATPTSQMAVSAPQPQPVAQSNVSQPASQAMPYSVAPPMMAAQPVVESAVPVTQREVSHSINAPEVSVVTNTDTQSQASMPALAGLRHQLRSKRQEVQNKGADGKKSDATSATPASALERIAQRAQQVQVSPERNDEDELEPEEEIYQWRPMQPIEVAVKSEVTPTQLKKALEHEKTPEMVAKLIEEAVAQDAWSALVQRLETAKMVEQLALNSAFVRQGDQISLTLRPSHAHLHNEKAQQELEQALNHVLGEACSLNITVGQEGETPLELRERLYQQKLTSALHSLQTDPNVQFIERRFNAQLDSDSVRPI